MTTFCTACDNNDRTVKISYFKYPEDEELRNKWLNALRRNDLQFSFDNKAFREKYRVCEEHFDRVFMIPKPGGKNIKVLEINAIPTFNLKNSPKVLNAKPYPSTYSMLPKIQANTGRVNKVSVVLPKMAFISKKKLTSSNAEAKPNTSYAIDNISNESCSSPDHSLNLSVIKKDTNYHFSSVKPILNKKNFRKRKGQNTKSDNTKKTKRSKCVVINESKERFYKLCDKFLNKDMAEIVKFNSGTSENKTKLNFNSFALSLYYSGPDTYTFLERTLNLPDVKALLIPSTFNTKLNEQILWGLKTKIENMSAQEKICSICVGYMPIKVHLKGQSNVDDYMGYHNINGVQKSELAKYASVITVRGIIHNWEQPIAHSFLSSCTDYDEINTWIDEIIITLLEMGLNIRVFITNMLCVEDTLNMLKLRFITSDKTCFEINSHKIYCYFGVPDLLTTMGCVFKAYNIAFNNQTAKLSHLIDLYNLDNKRRIKLVPQLQDMFINSLNFSSQKFASLIFSRNVGSAIETYVDLKIMDDTAKHTAEFINKMSDLLDILRSSIPVCENNDNCENKIKNLQNILTFLENLVLIRNKDSMLTTSPENSLHSFKIAIKSILHLYKELQLEGIKFLHLKRLNKDCVDKAFRKVCDNQKEESVITQVTNTFKEMFSCNVLKPVHGKNCCKIKG